MTATEFSNKLVETSKGLRPFAMKMTKNSEEAKDLIQESIVKAFTNRHKFAEGTNLKAWLYTIMRNTFITNYQRAQRRNCFVDQTDNQHYINSSDHVIRNGAYSNFAMEDINEAVEKLDDLYRVPFVLFVTGFKYHEIADQMEIPIGTVKNRIHVARRMLKDNLAVYEKNYAA